MKNYFCILAMSVMALFFVSCSNDEDNSTSPTTNFTKSVLFPDSYLPLSEGNKWEYINCRNEKIPVTLSAAIGEGWSIKNSSDYAKMATFKMSTPIEDSFLDGGEYVAVDSNSNVLFGYGTLVPSFSCKYLCINDTTDASYKVYRTQNKYEPILGEVDIVTTLGTFKCRSYKDADNTTFYFSKGVGIVKIVLNESMDYYADTLTLTKFTVK